MAKFRVKAFFMHAHEAAAANRAVESKVLTDVEWTDGFVIGVIDENDIPNLARQGLVITPIEIVEPTRDPDAPQTRGGETRARAAAGMRGI
jgi:serine protease AprX